MEALENGVSQYEDGAGRFLQISGMTMTVDLSMVIGNRISEVMIGGELLDMGKTYNAVSNNFVRNGGDGFDMFTDAENVYDFGADLADVTAEYIAENAPYQPYTDGRINMK